MARLLLALLLALSMGGCTDLFFMPMHDWVRTPRHLGLDYENVYFASEDGTRLHGWFLPAARGSKARGTVIFLHGNAQNVSTHIASVHWLPERGFNVFLMDYRGYGSSEGAAGLEDILADVRAGVRYALQRSDVEAGQVAVWGQSLGAALLPAALAECDCRRDLAAVVLDSGFSGFRAIARNKLSAFWLTWPLQYPLSLLVTDRYSPERFVADFAPSPVLIVHNLDDRAVPPRNAKRLYAAAREPKQLWLIPGRGHIQTTRSPLARERLVAYFSRHFGE